MINYELGQNSDIRRLHMYDGQLDLAKTPNDEENPLLTVLKSELPQFSWDVDEDEGDYICGSAADDTLTIDLYPIEDRYRAFITVDLEDAIDGQAMITSGVPAMISVYREHERPTEAVRAAIGALSQGVKEAATRFYSVFPNLIPKRI